MGAPGPSALGAAGKPTSPLQTPPAFHSSFFFLFASFKRQRRFLSWPVRGSEGQPLTAAGTAWGLQPKPPSLQRDRSSQAEADQRLPEKHRQLEFIQTADLGG